MLGLLVLATVAQSPPAASFEELPIDCMAISADGKTVVGFLRDDNYHPYAWSKKGGVRLIFEDASIDGVAEAVSADGKVIAGRWLDKDGYKLFISVNGKKPRLLDIPALSIAMSDDGKWIVCKGQKRETAIYILHNGVVVQQILANFGISAISGDGRVLVGSRRAEPKDGKPRTYSDVPELPIGEAMYWKQTSGVVPIGRPDPYESTSLTASNFSGSVFCGYGRTKESLYVPFLWTSKDGFEELPLPRGAKGGFSPEITNDGKVVVCSLVPSGVGVWRPGVRPATLREILANRGVDTGDVQLGFPIGMSADGTVIIGLGYDENGQFVRWIVELPRS